jgi:hypothetical protein
MGYDMNLMLDDPNNQGSAADFDQLLEELVRKIANGDATAEDQAQYEGLALRKSLRMRKSACPPRNKDVA